MSTEGVGPLTLVWPLESGSWTAVVMNADGSAGVTADLAFGAKISDIIAIAWGVLAFGLCSLLAGGLLVFRGFRRRNKPEESTGVADWRDPAPTDMKQGAELRETVRIVMIR